MDSLATTLPITNTLLAVVDQLGKRVRILDVLVKMAADRITPIRSASAACDGAVCYTQCEQTEDCCTCGINQHVQLIRYKAVEVFGCDGADYCPGPCSSSCPFCNGC